MENSPFPFNCPTDDMSCKKLNIIGSTLKVRSQAKQKKEEPKCAVSKVEEKEGPKQNRSEPNCDFSFLSAAAKTTRGQNLLMAGQLLGKFDDEKIEDEKRGDSRMGAEKMALESKNKNQEATRILGRSKSDWSQG